MKVKSESEVAINQILAPEGDSSVSKIISCMFKHPWEDNLEQRLSGCTETKETCGELFPTIC